MTEPEVATPTPDEALETEEAPSPEEQELAEETNQPADTDATAAPDPRVAQAEYTRSQQAFSQVKGLLGLDRKATREDVLAALSARLAEAPTEGEEPAPEDPRVTEAQQRAWEAEYRYVSAIYPDYADPVLEFTNLARTSDSSYEELVATFAQAVEAAVERRMAGQPAPAAAAASEAELEEELEVGVPTEDQAPSGSAEAPTEPPPYRRRESAVVSAIRGIFGEAGVSPPQ